MKKTERIIEHINNMYDDELVSIWNEYQRAIGGDDYIYSMYDLDDILYGYTPTQIISNLVKFDYYGDSYFTISLNEDITSIRNVREFIEKCEYIENIADWALSNEDSLGDEEIEEILRG